MVAVGANKCDENRDAPPLYEAIFGGPFASHSKFVQRRQWMGRFIGRRAGIRQPWIKDWFMGQELWRIFTSGERHEKASLLLVYLEVERLHRARNALATEMIAVEAFHEERTFKAESQKAQFSE